MHPPRPAHRRETPHVYRLRRALAATALVLVVFAGLNLVGAAWQHAAVMAREFGIPAVTGTKDGTSVIEDGQTITVDGDVGVVELG